MPKKKGSQEPQWRKLREKRKARQAKTPVNHDVSAQLQKLGEQVIDLEDQLAAAYVAIETLLPLQQFTPLLALTEAARKELLRFALVVLPKKRGPRKRT